MHITSSVDDLCVWVGGTVVPKTFKVFFVSRAAGYHYLGNYDGKLFNGPIYVLAKVIKDVMSSEVEAESESLFLNAGEAVQYIKTLEEEGHIQHPVRLRTDNNTASVIANKKIKVSKAKKWDMHDWWMNDRI